MSTLTITVGERDRLDERTRRRIEAADEGTELDDAEPTLNLASYEDLNRLLRPTNLELMAVVADRSPESIRETADLVDRDYKQVHRNLGELEDLGVLEFEGGSPGEAKRPVLPHDELEIDLPLAELGARGGFAGADAD